MRSSITRAKIAGKARNRLSLVCTIRTWKNAIAGTSVMQSGAPKKSGRPKSPIQCLSECHQLRTRMVNNLKTKLANSKLILNMIKETLIIGIMGQSHQMSIMLKMSIIRISGIFKIIVRMKLNTNYNNVIIFKAEGNIMNSSNRI